VVAVLPSGKVVTQFIAVALRAGTDRIAVSQIATIIATGRI
jgi:coenzyme F420-reducing hydrogenase delta subunit